MIADEIHLQEKTGFRLSEHPWISLVVLNVISILAMILMGSSVNWIGIAVDAPYRPLLTPTLAHILVLFLIVPFGLRLPNGRTTLRKYLEDIRFASIRPFIPLLILGFSSSLIMLLLLSVNSLIYQLSQELNIDLAFLRRVIDLHANLPPQSLSYIVSFPAIFEEVSCRGVMLVLFLKYYSVKKSILITALNFGLFHFINLLGGVAPDFVIRQVIFGSALGFFYGYLVLRSNSLMPAMLFHYLVNMFIGSFTHYFQQYAPAGTQILYTAINLPLSAIILILWVKLFCNRWISRPTDLKLITL